PIKKNRSPIEENRSPIEKNRSPIKKDRSSAITPNRPPMRPCIKIRVPRRIRQELERELIECLPPPNANIFTISLPPITNNKPDPDLYMLDWRNIDFI